ncbi:PfkB family carbohydrate kinase [Magnetospirillum sp. UT-4]|uniref:PfkB family carbohydrate kinase n=1 Tax=Magnetospirillum sp. UT-4 TaxID=2681467 RepID=UPI001383F666|nr:PfkB family carbohydrate kinase [Magnetospirillum sp. UT-4]CAA7615156.1 PfkB family carbohydrate kinase [Magnetospirillum sp. UT-4]
MARIVVVGSVASDEVVRLEGRCREGAHLQGRAAGTRLGGGGANTAVALAAAGHRVSLVTAIGDDEAGAWQLAALADAGIDTSAIRQVPGPSTRSILLVDPEGERTIVNLGRAREPEPPGRLLHLAADLIYVRTRTIGLAPLLAEAAARCPVVAHVPPVEDGVFPARIVLGSAADLSPQFLADPVGSARRVAGDLLRWMVLTRGPQGAMAFPTEGAAVAVAPPPVAAVDSTGAGDAFAAGLCHALAEGRLMAEALAVAVRWGAAKVAQDGSALRPETVRGLLA